jgi:GntR family transcriptional regulator
VALGPIDPTADRPVYLQIADRLREAIASEALPPGAQLPSERALMEQFGAARGTVRQAIGIVKTEGLIDTAHGRGAFVRTLPPVRRVAHDRFARRHREQGKAAYLAEIEAEGRTPEVEVLEVGPAKAPEQIATRLGLRPGAKVLTRRRRYLADRSPMELATSYVPWKLAQGTDMTRDNPGPGGIYARLEERGHRLGSFAEEVSARMPSPDERRSLQLAAGVPILVVVRTAFDIDGIPVEVCDTIMAADRYVLAYELPAI